MQTFYIFKARLIHYLDFFQEPKRKAKEPGTSLKRKEIESDEDSPPRKAATHRRMAIVYDSDDE